MSIGLLSSLYFYPYVFVQIPVGVFSDIAGALRTVVGFTLMSVIGCTLFAIAHDFYALLIARALIGIGVAGTFAPPLR